MLIIPSPTVGEGIKSRETDRERYLGSSKTTQSMDGRGEEAKRIAGMSSANALKKNFVEYQQYQQ